MKYVLFLGLSVAVVSAVFLYGDMNGVVIDEKATLIVEGPGNERVDMFETQALTSRELENNPGELPGTNLTNNEYVLPSLAIESSTPVDTGNGGLMSHEDTVSLAIESELPVDTASESDHVIKTAAIESDMPVMAERESTTRTANFMPAIESDMPVMSEQGDAMEITNPVPAIESDMPVNFD